jgi:integrase/recombinase XerD
MPVEVAGNGLRLEPGKDVGISKERKRYTDMEEKIVKVLNEMAEYLSIAQMKKLQEVIIDTFAENKLEKTDISNADFLQMFLDAKRVEGCSDRTIDYYKSTIEHLISTVDRSVRKISTEEIREYLSSYQKRNNCTNVTVDNVRRNISSFFSWLEEEDHILKSPMKRIHKIKTKTVVKNVISDEAIEKLRDNCRGSRDLAIIDLLYSTGIRVGELVNLNIDDIDLEGRECIVYGKGDKERRVYFDAKAKVHLKNYLDSRDDANEALFVTLDSPHERLKISGVEIRLRQLGRRLNIDRVHPHKFRRTMATRAIDKGMPIEQVQKILGHSQIDTTMQYAMVNQTNVKTSHQKYMA